MAVTACPRCARPMPATATFCRRCGMRISTAAPSAPALPRAPIPFARTFEVARAAALSPIRRFSRAQVIGLVTLLAVVLVSIVWFVVWSVSRPLAGVATSRGPVVPFAPPVSPPPARAKQLPLPSLPQWTRHIPAEARAKSANAVGLDMRGQYLTQPRFEDGSLNDATFAGAYLIQGDFEKRELRRADFRGAELSQCRFAGADLAGARFDEAYLHQCGFVSVDTAAVDGRMRNRDGIIEPMPPPPLLAKNLATASFRQARFSQVSLERLDLSKVDFSDASFQGVNFANADLRGADLHGSRHQYSDFTGANLEGADLRGADLSSARNLTAYQLLTARTDEKTRRPQ